MVFGQNEQAYKEINKIIEEQGDMPEPQLLRIRGTIAFNLGRSEEVIDNGNLILEMEETNPTITQEDILFAHILRCRGYLALGFFEESLAEAEAAHSNELIHSCKELIKVYNMAINFTEHGKMQEATRAFDAILETAPQATEIRFLRSDIAWNMNDFDKFEDLSKEIEKSYLDSLTFMYRRGVSSFCNGQFDRAKTSFRRANFLEQIDAEISDNISLILPIIDTVRNLQNSAKKALQADQNNKAEMLTKEALQKIENVCPEKCSLSRNLHSIHLSVLKTKGEKDKLLDELDTLLTYSPDCSEFLLERARLNLEKKFYDAAIFDLQNLQRREPNNMMIMKLLNEAQEGKRKTEKIDYYGILGLPQGSSIQEVKHAYHQMIRKWHPDQFKNEKKKEAEKMMKKINKAAEVLEDPEKKAIVDNGGDPENPQANMNLNINPMNIINLMQGKGFQMNGQPIKIVFNMQ